eukprot:3667344-Rhodomonas_salina.1
MSVPDIAQGAPRKIPPSTCAPRSRSTERRRIWQQHTYPETSERIGALRITSCSALPQYRASHSHYLKTVQRIATGSRVATGRGGQYWRWRRTVGDWCTGCVGGMGTLCRGCVGAYRIDDYNVWRLRIDPGQRAHGPRGHVTSDPPCFSAGHAAESNAKAHLPGTNCTEIVFFCI